MRSLRFEHPLLNFFSPANLVKLHSHIAKHETSVAELPYEPINAPHKMRPLHLSTVFDPTLLDDNLLFELFENMSNEAERAISGFLRVYIDGMLSPKHENNLLYTLPKKDESFKDYLTRATEGHKASIVINGAEQWSETLARLAVRISKPILEAQGATRSTVEATLFMGNYGYTPFGIHIDDPFTSVIHCHCGPAVKTMTLFSIEEFHKINGPRKNCFDPSSLIPLGQTFSIKQGDIFLLPSHYYHVGHTDGFSIGIAIAISKYPGPSTAQQILQHAIVENDFFGSIDQLIDRAENLDLSLATWLRTASMKQDAKATSQARLRYSPRGFHDQNMISKDALWLPNPDFPMTFLGQVRHNIIFVRGHQIHLKKSSLTDDLVEKIPDRPFSIKDLYKIMKKRISLSAIENLISHLVYLGGLVPAEKNENRLG
ncbi:hypothetical protein [Sodalis sp. dw_96]|uniref:hypothetical protein n=1 Tax=Sodalis sp. dw_96 TaxID=2719794 RepID=UPI001BD51E13|nr:hypothetical protein [Sodalis sp. dw_96]